jgi:hypothetical protein
LIGKFPHPIIAGPKSRIVSFRVDEDDTAMIAAACSLVSNTRTLSRFPPSKGVPVDCLGGFRTRGASSISWRSAQRREFRMRVTSRKRIRL